MAKLKNNNRNSGSNNTKKRRRRRASNDTNDNNNNQKTILVAIILGLCLINILDVDISIGRNTNSSSGGGRRSLLSSLYLSGPSTLLPWAQHHLVDVTDRPTETETALFWRKLLLFVCVLFYYISVVVP